MKKLRIIWSLSTTAKLRRARTTTPTFTASKRTKYSGIQIVIMATYEEVKDIPNHPEQYLIDVRDRDELKKTGVIPASINIPLVELNGAFKMSEEEFQTAFKREKPKQEAVIIFSCLAGGRAQNATNVAQTLGYKNAKVYKGSWAEWAEKEGL